MRRFISFLTALLLWPSLALAQVPMTGAGLGTPSSGVASCTAADNFIARTSGLTQRYTDAYKTLICGLVTDGVWSTLDVLQVYATKDATTAVLNLVSASYAATNHSASFTIDNGFNGNGSSTYVDTGFAPSAGVNYTQNLAQASIWDLTSRSADTTTLMGAVNSSNLAVQFIPYFTANMFFTRVNDISGSQANAVGSAAFFLGNRTSSSVITSYINGSSIGTPAAGTSGSLTTIDVWAGCRNNGGSFSAGSTDIIAVISFGANLTTGNITNFYNRLHTYLQTIAGIS